MRLEGKTALITGASRNIGREVALTFAREGADLLLNTRSSQEELEVVAAQCRELGVNTHTVLGDVSDPERVSQMVQEGIDALGKIDVLVNNVAIRPHRPVLDVSNEEWHQVFATNLDSAFYLIKSCPARDDRTQVGQHYRPGWPGCHHRKAGNRHRNGCQVGVAGVDSGSSGGNGAP